MKLKRISSRVAIIGVIACVLFAGLGAFAYWSVQQQIAGNKLATGSMTMDVIKIDGAGVTRALDVSGIMPGDQGLASWEITIGEAPASGDDLVVSVSNVEDLTSLADNVQVALLICTGGMDNWWMTPSGPVTLGTDNPDTTWQSHTFAMSQYNGISWQNMPGYVSLPEGAQRHIKLYYTLPLDCASDCHDDQVTFDLTVEAQQHH